jgi:hypothetical protein
MNWRVDVAISTTAVSRVFRPSLVLRVTLSDGRVVTCECSVRQFHALRYQVARVLKTLHDLREHPMLLRDLDK